MKHESRRGHLAAIITILIWGTTFISTKILLKDFQPVEILVLRFLIGTVALFAVYPRCLKGTTKKQELHFALAGLCGICLYYLLENIALTFTLASNVGAIVSTAPFFTAIVTRIFMKQEERLRASFFIGFAAAIAGICLLSFGGSNIELNPAGDLLALLAALVWAFYSVLTKKISAFGYNTIQATRRMFQYGVFFMLPAMYFFDFHPDIGLLVRPINLFNFLFLGLGASALCFATWNFAVKVLGAVKTSVYIYMVPVITVLTSILILKEQITGTGAFGILLTLAGLILSEGRLGKRQKGKEEQEGEPS